MVSQRNFVQSRDTHELKKEISPSRKPKGILVLDLDETLVHYNMAEDHFALRPFVKHFLKNVSRTWEVIIFTAGKQEFADKAIEQIDP